MKDLFSEVLANLLSRKLWLAVGAFAAFMAAEKYLEAAGVVIGYFGANAYEAKK